MNYEDPVRSSWLLKPTDRFVLRWIKCHLSAQVTVRIKDVEWLRPWMITMLSSALGILAGGVFALGWGFLAGVIGAVSQVLDGVDGQLARLSDRQSKGGAYLDSVLDRYADGAMVIGLILYLTRLPLPIPLWLLLCLGAFALIGSGNISYGSARAESLGMDLGSTLVSKGTRTTVIVLGALATLLWPYAPMISLAYLVIHPNAVVVQRLIKVYRAHPPRD